MDFGLMNYYNDNFGLKTSYTWKDVEMFVYLQLLFNLWDFDNLYFYQTLNESEIDFIYKKQTWIVPIEVKSTHKDNIPKIFMFFCEKYKDQIEYMIKTVKFGIKSRQENCLIKFIPFLNLKTP
jgi:predicted AAA+ superfamily ATPase